MILDILTFPVTNKTLDDPIILVGPSGGGMLDEIFWGVLGEGCVINPNSIKQFP